MPSNIRRILVLSALVAAAQPLAAQAPGRVRGIVLESATGRALPDAVVLLEGQSGVAVTDAAGRFALRTPPDSLRLIVSRLGYGTVTVAARAGDDLRIHLEQAPLAIDAIVVSADRPFEAATSRIASEIDIRVRPRESAQELLRLAPGLVIAQHAGGGKAEQIFLRGFDADHGTDVALSVDGTPVNIVSHAHGQGYADLHFLMPEVVERLIVRKGPYAAEDGDFATAGSVTFETVDRAPRETGIRIGSFGTAHIGAIVPFGGDAAAPGGYAAAGGLFSDGPFDSPQAHTRGNLFVKATAPVRTAKLTAAVSAFGADWRASGQIPDRAVRAGRIDRFGSIDDSEGGRTSRMEANARLSGSGDGTAWSLRVYGVRYRFDLFSNFTFFATDPERGDGIEQVDRRWIGGAEARYSRTGRVLGMSGHTSGGIGLRADRARVLLFDQSARERVRGRVDASVAETRWSGWAERSLEVTGAFRVRLGVRGDAFSTLVSDEAVPASSGRGGFHARVSPKLGFALDVARGTTLFGNAGAGFHSNDARAVAIAGDCTRVLPRAVGAELGLRHTNRRGSLSLALWRLDLESELVYIGDEGTTEASGRTRRVGAEATARIALLDWLWTDMDASLSRGRFLDEPEGANRIPLAPSRTFAGGLTALRPDWRAGLRWRSVGARPADETNAVRALGYDVWELFGERRFGSIEVTIAVDNLFDAVWNEAQFAATSRLRGEPAPVTDLHYTPGAPRAFTLGVRYAF